MGFASRLFALESYFFALMAFICATTMATHAVSEFSNNKFWIEFDEESEKKMIASLLAGKKIADEIDGFVEVVKEEPN